MALTFRKQLARNPNQAVDILNETQDSILELVLTANQNPLINAVLIENVALTATASLVRHGLGYEPRGFVLANPTGAFQIYEDTAASNPDRKQFAALRTDSGSETVNILFF